MRLSSPAVWVLLCVALIVPFPASAEQAKRRRSRAHDVWASEEFDINHGKAFVLWAFFPRSILQAWQNGLPFLLLPLLSDLFFRYQGHPHANEFVFLFDNQREYKRNFPEVDFGQALAALPPALCILVSISIVIYISQRIRKTDQAKQEPSQVEGTASLVASQQPHAEPAEAASDSSSEETHVPDEVSEAISDSESEREAIEEFKPALAQVSGDNDDPRPEVLPVEVPIEESPEEEQQIVVLSTRSDAESNSSEPAGDSDSEEGAIEVSTASAVSSAVAISMLRDPLALLETENMDTAVKIALYLKAEEIRNHTEMAKTAKARHLRKSQHEDDMRKIEEQRLAMEAEEKTRKEAKRRAKHEAAMLAQAQSQFRQVSWSQVLVSASVFMMMLYRMGGLSLTTWLSWHMDWSTLGYVSSWSWMRPFALPDLGSVVWSFLRAGLSILACLIAFIVALWKLELRGAGKMVALIPIMLPFASLHRTAVVTFLALGAVALAAWYYLLVSTRKLRLGLLEGLVLSGTTGLILGSASPWLATLFA